LTSLYFAEKCLTTGAPFRLVGMNTSSQAKYGYELENGFYGGLFQNVICFLLHR
jgi:hypothetical protein